MVPAPLPARGSLGFRRTAPCALVRCRAVDLFDDLVWRRLAYQWTGDDDLPARLRSAPATVYHGLDPTADSLHIGNLIGLMALRRFQRAGHTPIAIAGGGTGMIGDPSGKSDERNLLSVEQLEHNLVGIQENISRFLDFDAPKNPARLLNNHDWLSRLSVIDFLRDVGKHFPVNVMLAKDSVKARLAEAGMSYTEFSYMLMQAYDFVHLNRTYGCEIQLGGSDQFGNITAGVDLARRTNGTRLFGFTWPLLTRSDGKKFGKTAEGTVWLSSNRTSPYALYQWFVQVPDQDAGPLLRSFTELDHDSIVSLEEQVITNPAQREAQKVLARELTLLVHGEGGLAAAERATKALFGGALDGLSEAALLEIFADVPSTDLPRVRLGQLTLVDALVESGLAKSKGDARRVVEAGGAYVNNTRVDADRPLIGADLASASVMVLRQGKRTFALLRFSV